MHGYHPRWYLHALFLKCGWWMELTQLVLIHCIGSMLALSLWGLGSASSFLDWLKLLLWLLKFNVVEWIAKCLFIVTISCKNWTENYTLYLIRRSIRILTSFHKILIDYMCNPSPRRTVTIKIIWWKLILQYLFTHIVGQWFRSIGYHDEV